jgi:hypothetical protein
MPDLRLPAAKAQEVGLLPDLPVIRNDMMSAVVNLYGELIECNPRMPTETAWPNWPSCPLSVLNEAQRAFCGVYLIRDYVPPWEWLSLLLDKRSDLPLIVWAGRVAEIGKTGEYIEHLIRMNGGDPDALAAACASNPDTAHSSVTWKSRRLGRDAVRSASISWWMSDGPGYADFSERVFNFVLRRLSEFIAIEAR